jgi:hypothetical protein
LYYRVPEVQAHKEQTICAFAFGRFGYVRLFVFTLVCVGLLALFLNWSVDGWLLFFSAFAFVCVGLLALFLNWSVDGWLLVHVE